MNEQGPTIAGPVLEHPPASGRHYPRITVCSCGINEAITIRTFLFSLIGAVILLAIVNLFTRKSIR